MGNAKSVDKRTETKDNEKEMVHPHMYKEKFESLLSLDEVSEMCLKLEENVNSLSMSIDSVISGDGQSEKESQISNVRRSHNVGTSSTFSGAAYFGDEEEDATAKQDISKEREAFNGNSDQPEQIETKFWAKTRLIQNLIHELTEQLDHHSKRASSSFYDDRNDKLIKCVVSLVSHVNKYIAMLVRNIRKVRRMVEDMVSEEDPGMSRRVNRRDQNEGRIQDVVLVTQDIDAMLVELRATEKQREGLERDIIDVILISKDCRGIQMEREDALNSVESNVKMAAISIDAGHARKFIK